MRPQYGGKPLQSLLRGFGHLEGGQRGQHGDVRAQRLVEDLHALVAVARPPAVQAQQHGLAAAHGHRMEGGRGRRLVGPGTRLLRGRIRGRPHRGQADVVELRQPQLCKDGEVRVEGRAVAVQTGVSVPLVVQVVPPEVGVVPVARSSHPTGHLPISLLRMRLGADRAVGLPLSAIGQRGATDGPGGVSVEACCGYLRRA